MSSTFTYSLEDELEFTEMKPMAIYHQKNEQNEVSFSHFEFSSVADFPEATSSEMAFTSTNSEEENELTGIKIKMEQIETDSSYPGPPVTDSSSGFLHIGAVFGSFLEFEDAFRSWKEAGHHPMRIASSEALKDPSGKVDEKFRYKHAVYHCAHYGKPRFRGNGARPNQSYLPCGCPAMFRLNFNYFEQVLRITSMNVDHVGHPVTYEHYKAVCSNAKTGKRSRSFVESSTNSTVSPCSSNTSTAFYVKKEFMENEINEQLEKLAELQEQERELSGLFGAAKTPSCSGTSSRKGYGRKRKEIDSEQSTPKIKRERLDNNKPSSSPEIRVPVGNENEVAQEEYADTVIYVPALPGLPKLQVGAAYKNWSDFEAAFENWKSVGMHPMRVASSETMKDLNGVPNNIYKYKYVVFHCAHYGNPRIRGNGLRPNQHYLPCGCGSMLRLAYNFEDQTLRVNSMVEEHRGHPRDKKSFEKVMAKIRSSRGRRGTASFTNAAASSPIPIQPSTPTTETESDLTKLILMLSTQNQVLQLLQQNQSDYKKNDITTDKKQL